MIDNNNNLYTTRRGFGALRAFLSPQGSLRCVVRCSCDTFPHGVFCCRVCSPRVSNRVSLRTASVADGDFLPAWVVVLAAAWLFGQRRFFICYPACLPRVSNRVSLQTGLVDDGNFLPHCFYSYLAAAWLVGQRRYFTTALPLSPLQLFYHPSFPIACDLASFTRVVVVSHADVCMPPLHCILSASCSYCSLLTGPITLAVHALSCLPFLLLGFLCSTSVVSSFIVFLLGKSYWPSWALLFLCSLGRVLPIFTYLVSLGPAAVVSGSFAAR
jgi:hypothetical protein